MAIWRITNRIEYSGGGGPGFNVFHARRDTTGPDGNRFIEALETFYTSLAGLYNSDTSITVGESIVDVETDEFVESTPVTVSGTGLSTRTPRLLQIVVPWRTAVRARRGMGRTFIGPLKDVTGSDGLPSGPTLTTIGNAADALVAESQSLGLGAFGIWGYESAKPQGQPRPDDDPKVLRDLIGRGPVRANGFSYLSSRRD